MKGLGKVLLWMAVVAALLIAADQAMVRLPGPPGEARQGYLDLRSDLLGGAVDAPQAASPSPRYVYVDADGDLHFADSLQEVPSVYRSEAQRLEH